MYRAMPIGSRADCRILELQPRITEPAILACHNEEELLVQVADPMQYNDEVIYTP
jgi:hypothetical protein